MFNFLFRQKDIASKGFLRQREVTDNVNRQCKQGRAFFVLYVITRQSGGLFQAIKQMEKQSYNTTLYRDTNKTYLAAAYFNTTRNPAYKISINVSEIPELILYYPNIRNEVELQFFEKLITKSLKGEG